jgi:eukaryotic-like serine/threonine-protein kinase
MSSREKAPGRLDGEVIAGRYRLVEPIGSGGSSSVYRAFDQNRQAFRAVKILSAELASNDKLRRRLLQEAEVMARLQHPNVVTLHEAGTDGDRVYLVLELMPGGSMIERLAEGPLPPRMAVQVLTGVLSALELAHGAGVVHRDVKPHNVLLAADGTPKVTDFGIARGRPGDREGPEAGLTRTGAMLGTLAYMPPEQKLSSRRVDPRADVYAAGATLYALLTARPPHDLYAASLDEGIGRELYAGIPAPLAAVIRRATSFRPDDRFASAAAMSAALVAAIADLAPDPPSPPLVLPERLGRARALARLGPTLLGTTESGEGTTELLQLQVPPPAPRASLPRTLLIALAVLVGAAALVGSGWFLGVSVRRDTSSPRPEAGDAEVARVVDPSRVTRSLSDVGEAAVAVPSLDGAIDPPPAAPAPSRSPAPAPARRPSRSGSRWELQTLPNGRIRPDVTASLPADPVSAGDHRPVQPLLLLRCRGGRPAVVLRTGIEWMDPPEDRVELQVATSLGIEAVSARVDPSVRGELLLPSPGAWMARVLGEVRISFVAEGPNGPRITTFTPGDVEATRDALGDCL